MSIYMDQEKIIQIQGLEQEFNQLNQQLQLIEQNILEIQELHRCLDEIEKSDEKEMLANLGKGIYIPVEIKDKKLTVEVGDKNFVRKSIPDTKKIIEEQNEKLVLSKKDAEERLMQLQSEIECLLYHDHEEDKKKVNKKEED